MADQKKNVLFVDDEPNVTEGLKRMLRHMRKEWDMSFALSGPEALDILSQRHMDVIVSDMRMPGMDGAQLLSLVRERYPDIIRIVLSGQSSKEAILRAVGTAHQYLAKPCDAELLKQTVAKAFKLRDIVTGDRLKGIVSKLDALPVLPEIYGDLVEEMQSEEPSLSHIGGLIHKDVAMTAKILQVVNSAYFGIRRQITSPDEAVRYLGLENISSLALAANIFGQMDHKINVPGFSMAEMWHHSGEVAKLAQLILKSEDRSKQDVDEVLTAGLLHDCGRLIFAANMAEDYADVLRTVAATGEPVHSVEERCFGANHAEIGAYLLGIWGLPDSIVEAVAFHHEPGTFSNQGCVSLTAVHVAEAFLADPEAKGVDMAYLVASGVAPRLPEWLDLMQRSRES